MQQILLGLGVLAVLICAVFNWMSAAPPEQREAISAAIIGFLSGGDQ